MIEMTKLTEKVAFRPDLEEVPFGEEAQETVRKKQEEKEKKKAREKQKDGDKGGTNKGE